MTVAELNKKVDFLKQMVLDDGEMINKLRRTTELQDEQIKRLKKCFDVLYDKKLHEKKDDKVITISKQEFMEKAAAIGVELLDKDGGLIATQFVMDAATMGFYLFDKEEE